MASIATATLAYPDLTFWLGIGLWGVFALCAGEILFTVRTGRTAATLPCSSFLPRSSFIS